jgi:hypothetical protein
MGARAGQLLRAAGNEDEKMQINVIDQWEQEQAAIQMAIVRKEDAAFQQLSPEVRARINRQRADEQEAFATAAIAATGADDSES